MKNKIIAFSVIAVVLLSSIVLSGCGNKDIFDTNYTYDEAIIKMPDGSTISVEISQWSDYEGEQLQIIAKDGTIYLVNSVNCVLINHP